MQIRLDQGLLHTHTVHKHTHTRTNSSLYSHHRVPPGQGPGTDDGLDTYRRVSLIFQRTHNVARSPSILSLCSILSLGFLSVLLQYNSLSLQSSALVSCPHTVLYLGEPAHLVLCQAAAGASRCGGGFPSVPLHTRPNFQVMHPLPEHTGRRQQEVFENFT